MNIEDLGRQLADLGNRLEAMSDSIDAVNSDISNLKQEAIDLDEKEKEAIAGVVDAFKKSRKLNAEDIRDAEKEKEHLEQALVLHQASLSIAKSCFELASNRLEKEEVINVLEDLETSETPDFKSARLKLFPEQAEEEDQASAEQEAIAASG